MNVPNFIAVHLADNDFLYPMFQAVEYIQLNRECVLSVEAWQYHVVNATAAFNSIRCIRPNDHLELAEFNFEKVKAHIAKMISVTAGKTFADATDRLNFDGYVIDLNTGSIVRHLT
jgi:hypothetical protein